MTITTNCPGCNAPLQIEENTTFVSCPFCGTHFDVDPTQANPTFHKASEPEPAGPPETAPLQGEILPESSTYVYNPPISGETQAPTPNELYNPPILNAGNSEIPPIETPPPFYTPPIAQQPNFMSGARLWITIGVVILGAFCMTCLCLALFAFRAVR